MKQINYTCRWLVAAVCASTLLLSGCIQENLAACYKLTLKAENAKGDDVTGSALSDAFLYVFDENYEYLQTVRMTEGQINPAKRNVALCKNDTCKNIQKRRV